MTGNIERRIEALETDTSHDDLSLRVVVSEPGETIEQALRRERIEPCADNVLVVVFG